LPTPVIRTDAALNQCFRETLQQTTVPSARFVAAENAFLVDKIIAFMILTAIVGAASSILFVSPSQLDLQ
jgi:hypothetical protein